MALTPRSFLRSKPLMTAVVISAGMSIWGLNLFTNSLQRSTPPPQTVVKQTFTIKDVKTVDRLAELRGEGCDHVIRQNGSVESMWSVADWSLMASCFEAQENNALAERTAARGLAYHPRSETLHNTRGYNLIVMEEYDRAVAHLRVALQAVRPTDGVLQNNLAWAGLFASDKMTLSEARRHYKASLRHGGSCEAFHTGMWVEYGVAARSHGSARDAAIATYQGLRAKYEPCTSRVNQGDRTVGYEVAGAGILDQEMHKLKMVQLFERNQIDDGFAPLQSSLVRRSMPAMRISKSQVADACEDIAPVKSAQPACRKALQSAFCGN